MRALGRNHEILYFKTATAITDGDSVTILPAVAGG